MKAWTIFYSALWWLSAIDPVPTNQIGDSVEMTSARRLVLSTKMAAPSRKRRRGPDKPAGFLHILEDCTEETSVITKTRWETFRVIAKEWSVLGGKEAAVVQPVLNQLDTEYTELDSLPHYHPSCYKRFTDKRQLFYAKQRATKRSQLSEHAEGELLFMSF